MQTKNARKSSMRSASQIISENRERLVFLVQREERNTGSRTTAYHVIASQIGKSETWVRSIFKGYADAVPDLVVGLNIMELYDRVCSRVELEAEREGAEAKRLRNELHAANPSFMEMVEGEPGKKAAQASTQSDEE